MLTTRSARLAAMLLLALLLGWEVRACRKSGTQPLPEPVHGTAAPLRAPSRGTVPTQ